MAGDLPHLDLHIATCPVLEGGSTQRLGPLERKSLASVLSGGSLQDMDSMPYPLQRLSSGAPSSQRGVLALSSGWLEALSLTPGYALSCSNIQIIEIMLNNMKLQQADNSSLKQGIAMPAMLGRYALPKQNCDSHLCWCSLATAVSDAYFYWCGHCAIFTCGVARSICKEPLELHKQPACHRGSCQWGHDIPPQSGAVPGPVPSVA